MKFFLLVFCCALTASAQIVPRISTYLGDNQRNYYGNYAPNHLRVKWKTPLGSGKTKIGRKTVSWRGAGWTGQPLVIDENGETYLIQGTLSHHVKKIRARDGKLIWSTSVGDVIKGTPTFTDVGGKDPESRYVLIVGSRKGLNADFMSGKAYSLHGVSYLTGKILWQHNSRRTESNTRDVDASAIVLSKSKAAIPLENGYFTVFSPDPRKARMRDGVLSPKVHKQYLLYRVSDMKAYGRDLACESSPTYYRGKAWTAAGVGRVYGCGVGSFGGAGWSLDVGGDLNGSMPLTNDGHLLLGIEKQAMPGQGGVMKFKPGGKVAWYAPVPNQKFFEWKGGLVGSPAVNHRYRSSVSPDLACFVGVDAHLTLINHKKLQPGVMVPGPRKKKNYPTPLVLDRVKLPTGSISTPLFLGDKIIVGYDNGLDLYQVTPALKLKRLARLPGPMLFFLSQGTMFTTLSKQKGLCAALFLSCSSFLWGATFEEWRADNFTGASQTNDAVSGLLAIPRNDGFPNLIKYALGLTVDEIPSGQITEIAATSPMTVTFDRPIGLTVLFPGVLPWSE